MSKKSQEPKREFGFYATIPRIVRIKYKALSHAEKWLYVCLKDLCGDKGTCFRTLRTLSEETDVSTGSLSKMIPNLHKYGLIHAEKKRRTESGKEIWHISIVDIWDENAKACSKNEQSASEVVQNTNKDVQNLNENPGDCSENERDCSNFVDRGKNGEARTSEEITGEERTNGASQSNVSTSDSSSIHSFTHSSQVILSEKEQEIHQWWCVQKKLVRPPKVTQTLKEYWSELTQHIKTFEDFKSLYEHTSREIENDPTKLSKEVHPGNLVNSLNSWSQLQTQLKEESTPKEEVTDGDIAAKVEAWARHYKDNENIAEYQTRVKQIQRECSMDNSKFFDILHKAKGDTDYSGDKSMRSFFRMLNRQLGRNPVTVGNRHLQPLNSRPRL